MICKSVWLELYPPNICHIETPPPKIHSPPDLALTLLTAPTKSSRHLTQFCRRNHLKHDSSPGGGPSYASRPWLGSERS